MRKEPFTVGSYVHIVKRGARGMNIVRDDDDRSHFLKVLRYLNDAHAPNQWDRDIDISHIRAGYARPDSWAEHAPYVSVIAYCLMDNHFHLLVQERIEGGISKFMQRLCTSMAMRFNVKYQEKGTLFQGAYRSKTIISDDHLRYLMAYIHVKNPFERYPGGIRNSSLQFDRAYAWAIEDRFSGLADYIGVRNAPFIDHALVHDLFEDMHRFRDFAQDVIEGRLQRAIASELLLDD